MSCFALSMVLVPRLPPFLCSRISAFSNFSIKLNIFCPSESYSFSDHWSHLFGTLEPLAIRAFSFSDRLSHFFWDIGALGHWSLFLFLTTGVNFSGHWSPFLCPTIEVTNLWKEDQLIGIRILTIGITLPLKKTGWTAPRFKLLEALILKKKIQSTNIHI